MRKHLFVLSLALTLMVGCSQQRGNEPESGASNSSAAGTTDANNQTSANQGGDRQFMTEAANGGLKEVELSNYVAQNTKNAEVKRLAQRIAQDHRNANQELMSIAQQDNVQVPTTMDENANQEVSHMKQMTGAELDRTYVQHMVEDHEKHIQKFQDQAENATSSQVKSFAQKTLPVLQEHLRMAQAAQSKLGQGQSESPSKGETQ
jgi:putative membrane protein